MRLQIYFHGSFASDFLLRFFDCHSYNSIYLRLRDETSSSSSDEDPHHLQSDPPLPLSLNPPRPHSLNPPRPLSLNPPRPLSLNPPPPLQSDPPRPLSLNPPLACGRGAAFQLAFFSLNDGSSHLISTPTAGSSPAVLAAFHLSCSNSLRNFAKLTVAAGLSASFCCGCSSILKMAQ